MYGQTNCFVLPEGDYGAFEVVGGDVLIISERSARGLAYQGLTPEWGVAKSLVNMKGSDLLGLPLKAPNAVYERVYTLPLMTISMGKGTGVVTSVPSDAPDDYAALKELKDKPLWREKLGLTSEMVEPFEVVPIIGQSVYFLTSVLLIYSSYLYVHQTCMCLISHVLPSSSLFRRRVLVLVVSFLQKFLVMALPLPSKCASV